MLFRQARTQGGKPKKETPVLAEASHQGDLGRDDESHEVTSSFSPRTSADVVEETATPSEFSELKQPLEIINERNRLLERLVLLSVFKEMSIQELLEEALELLFQKYSKEVSSDP